MCDLSKVIEPAASASIEQISPLQVAIDTPIVSLNNEKS